VLTFFINNLRVLAPQSVYDIRDYPIESHLFPCSHN
jgi:hypothetical protein